MEEQPIASGRWPLTTLYDALVQIMGPEARAQVLQGLLPMTSPSGSHDPVCGPAVCVRLFEDPAAHLDCRAEYFDVLDGLPADSALVIEAVGLTGAVLGDLVGLRCKQRDIAGVLVDGSVRDTVALQEINLPVLARGCCLAGGLMTRFRVERPERVHCGGTAVHVGDPIHWSADGIVAIPQQVSRRVYELADHFVHAELHIRKAILAGESLRHAYPPKPRRSDWDAPAG